MRISNLRFAPLLTGSFVLLLLLVAAICALGIAQMRSVRADLDEIVNFHNARTRLLSEMMQSAHRASEEMRVLPLLQDPQQLAQQKQAFELSNAAYGAAERRLESLRLAGDERGLLQEIKTAQQAAGKLNQDVVQFSLESRITEATDLLLGDATRANALWVNKLQALAQLSEQYAKQANEHANASYRIALLGMLGLGLVALLLGAGVSWLTTRAVTLPLKTAVGAAQRVAAGDLRETASSQAGNETGELLRALAKMTANLKEVVSRVLTSANAIDDATGRVSAGATELSTRTEQSASSLEQTAASMEQFGSTVAQNAGNAQQAAALASKAAGIAAEGGQAFAQIVQSMNSVDGSAKKIVDIIAVIDGIAFQTNILALNAAVEAARAGDQGRGFAVVANEVRVLAQRSAAAAKEVGSLIRDSVQQIDTASTIVAQGSATMQQILEANEQVRHLIGDIASASAEQNLGIAQVSSAVQQMERLTQQNAQLVQQTASAAEAMTYEAKQLVQAVQFFDTGAPVRAAEQDRATAPSTSTRMPAASARAPVRQPKLLASEASADDDWATF